MKTDDAGGFIGRVVREATEYQERFGVAPNQLTYSINLVPVVAEYVKDGVVSVGGLALRARPDPFLADGNIQVWRLP